MIRASLLSPQKKSSVLVCFFKRGPCAKGAPKAVCNSGAPPYDFFQNRTVFLTAGSARETAEERLDINRLLRSKYMGRRRLMNSGAGVPSSSVFVCSYMLFRSRVSHEKLGQNSGTEGAPSGLWTRTSSFFSLFLNNHAYLLGATPIGSRIDLQVAQIRVQQNFAPLDLYAIFFC
jgi:hypothetical protein